MSVHNPGRQPHEWGEAATAQLRQRWADGAVTALIGAELGISKSAVVGKARRLGLPPRASPIHAAGQAPVVRPRKRPTRPAPAPAPEPPAPPPVVVAPPPEPVAPRGCQYPRGSRPNWDWCDAAVVGNGPYCREHHRVCYLRPGTRAWMQERAEEAA